MLKAVPTHLIMYLLHATESFWRSWPVCS